MKEKDKIMKEQVLTEVQMDELVKIGFDPVFMHEHSSMMFVKYPNPCKEYADKNPILTRLVPASGEYYGIDDIVYIPTFTLFDMLSILPIIKRTCKDVNGELYEQCAAPDFHINGELSSITYRFDKDITVRFSGSLTYCAFKMLKWCKEKGYLEKNAK